MRQIYRCIISVILFVILCTCLPISTFAITYNDTQSSNPDNLKVGDKIYYGNYPQTKVTDSALISTLTSLVGSTDNWTSYGYFSGTGYRNDGKRAPKDYMKYTDVEYNNEKYRGVYFTSYRPNCTWEESLAEMSSQYRNGYYVNTMYFFKYEPLCWQVLDPDTGFCMCHYIIDSQAYNNYMYFGEGKKIDDYNYFGDSAHTYYASDYANSSIRKWLNEDFYNTAFNEIQKKNIKDTILNNDSMKDLEYNSEKTTDKIFLLSFDEIYNSAYGFTSDDSCRRLAYTDYASCNGLEIGYISYISDSNDNGLSDHYFASWLLRSPYDSYGSAKVWASGEIDDENIGADYTFGIVPALKISDIKSDIIKTLNDDNLTKTETVITTNSVTELNVNKTNNDTHNNKYIIVSIVLAFIGIALFIARKKIKHD